MGGPENVNFPLLDVVKMSLRRCVGGSKKPQNTLTYYKNGPLARFLATYRISLNNVLP